MFTNEEINKLPKWAQQRINTLQSNVEYYKSQVDQITGKEKTKVSIDRFDKDPSFLPKNSRIKYILKEGEITITHQKNTLEVHAKAYNADLAIRPVVNNVLKILLIKEQ